MAPTTAPFLELDKRYTSCPSGYYYSNGYCYRNSGWYSWGRWLFAGIIIVVVIACLAIIGCINSRRRRKRGVAPRYGMGWMAPESKYGQQNNNPNVYQPPPPQYGAPAYGNQPQYGNQQYAGNVNDGYYGQGHNEGVAPPPSAYYPQQQRGGDNVYAPPAGPPPGK